MKKILSLLAIGTITVSLSACTVIEDEPEVTPKVTQETTRTATPRETREPTEEITPTETGEDEEDSLETPTPEVTMEEEDEQTSTQDPDFELEDDQAKVETISIEIENDTLTVNAKGNHPDYCTGIDKYSWERMGDEVNVDLRTKQISETCAQSLKPFDQEIEINLSSFKPGDYSVNVNGVSTDFSVEEE